MTSRCSLCVCVCARACVSPLSLLGNDSIEITLSLLGNGDVSQGLTCHVNLEVFCITQRIPNIQATNTKFNR
jgi:hypothetical protein